MVRYSPEQIAASQRAIRDSAARLFRQRGFSGVGIDELCRDAGLTRGTFYSHFASKSDLFTAVVAGAHDFVRRLKARTGTTTPALRKQAAKVASDYLANRNRTAVIGGCSLASLAIDSSRAGPEAQAAYAEAVSQVVAEFRRGAVGDELLPVDQARAALALCVGGLLISGACGDNSEGRAVAKAARREVQRLLT